MVIAAFDRTPPQNQDAEKAVLAAMMLDKDAIYEVIQIINQKDFYWETHGIIFQAIIELAEKGSPIKKRWKLRKNRWSWLHC
jgi:replicative DNA helicase